MPALPPRDVGKMPGGYGQHYGQQGTGGWSGVGGGGRSGMDMPNLQTLGLGGGAGGTQGLGALNIGMPVNPAMVSH